MSASASHVAHHFDDAEQQFEAAGLGMWVFLATEILFFGGMFAGYTVYRYWYPEAFAIGSHHLNLVLGTINTVILLTSSLTMALAVHAAQTSHRRATVMFLTWTLVLGGLFLGIKAFEYYQKFEQNLFPGPSFNYSAALGDAHLPESTAGHVDAPSPPGNGLNSMEQLNEASTIPALGDFDYSKRAVRIFYSFYFAMTGLHSVHMIIGLVILSIIIVAARRGAFSAAYYTPVEIFGLYWHFVDIVWVFVFPLMYLIH